MNKRTVIAELNKIANELDNSGKFNEANQITNVMKRIAQMAPQVAAPAPAPVAPPFSNPVIPAMPAAPAPALGTPLQPAAPAAPVTNTTRPPYAISAGAQGTPTPQANPGQMFGQGLGNAARNQQQPVLQGFGNALSQTTGDTANQMQAMNANPNAQQESNEQRLYMNALNDIENAFKQNDVNTANAIYEKTYSEFKNPKRKNLFQQQIQRVRNKILNPKFNQGPKQQ